MISGRCNGITASGVIQIVPAGVIAAGALGIGSLSMGELDAGGHLILLGQHAGGDSIQETRQMPQDLAIVGAQVFFQEI